MFGHKNTGVKGAILVDNKVIADTYQCVHCGGHWIVQAGSGTRRGFCLHCTGPTCGSLSCDSCIPFEAKLEYTEAEGMSAVRKLLARYPYLEKSHL